jgi:hypothetical protein
MLKPWWELWSGRLEYELAVLDAAAIHYERDARALARGKINLRLKVHLSSRLKLAYLQ